MTKLLARVAAVSFLILAPLQLALADEGNFITPAQIDLVRLLPPPPAQDGAVTKAELAEVLTLQQNATPARIEQASLDAEETLFRFAYQIFPTLKADKVPLSAAFFQKLSDDEGLIIDAAKDKWKRQRPFLADDRIKPLAKRSTSGAYPSGHTAFGTLVGIVLADMIPEKKTEIFARTEDYGFSRMVAGLHYRSDVFASRMAGTAMVAIMMQNDKFKAEAAAAKTELRAALGL
jgi:acid phosphatase (class A)